MNSKRLINLALYGTCVFATVIGTNARAETRERLAENLERYERFAGEPVEQIRNFRLHRWYPLGRHELAIWANPGAVYLVRVNPPCDGLDFAKTIGTTGVTRTLMSRFDSIVFDHQRCSIRSIQPVDYKAMRAERKAAEREADDERKR